MQIIRIEYCAGASCRAHRGRGHVPANASSFTQTLGHRHAAGCAGIGSGFQGAATAGHRGAWTAQEELKQALGVSVITAEDIQKAPPVNDIAEIIRKQPGVNLTGNSGSGARGNNRQIDIRGMGPENTLILIDGKPVSSRNAVRYGWRGDRDTRGDTNWVPAEQIERIEVLRGPAAARYGSGAAGGVVNIITKQAGLEHHGNLSLYANMPQHSEEGATRRYQLRPQRPAGGEHFLSRLRQPEQDRLGRRGHQRRPRRQHQQRRAGGPRRCA